MSTLQNTVNKLLRDMRNTYTNVLMKQSNILIFQSLISRFTTTMNGYSFEIFMIKM